MDSLSVALSAQPRHTVSEKKIIGGKGWLLYNFLTNEECTKLIELCEATGNVIVPRHDMY